jgi:hypothetical protein
MRCVDAQIAFLGMPVLVTPNRSAGWIRARIHAAHTANAFFRIYPPDIPILFIHVECPGRTGLQTSRLYTLSALMKCDILRKSLKRVLDDLDPGQGEILSSFMHQRARKHTRHTSLAFSGIHEKVSAGGRDRCQPIA